MRLPGGCVMGAPLGRWGPGSATFLTSLAGALGEVRRMLGLSSPVIPEALNVGAVWPEALGEEAIICCLLVLG